MDGLRNNLKPLGCVYTYKPPSGVKQEWIISQPNLQGTREMIAGSVNTGSFKPGVLRINPVTIGKATGAGKDGTLKSYHASYDGYPNPTYSLEIKGCFCCNAQLKCPADGWDQDLAYYSSVKAHAKLGEAALDVGIMLAELGETLQMLRNPFLSLRNYLFSGPKGRGKGTDMTADTWLEYRYGLTPLISDVQDIIEAVNSKLSKNLEKLESVRGGITHEQTSLENSFDVLGNFTWTGRHKTVRTIKSTSIVYYSRLVQLTTAQNLGLSPDNWPLIAWEKVPYSFIVDWFFNVGQWLRALTPVAGLNVLGGCVSQVIKYDYEYELLTKPFNDYYTIHSYDAPSYRWTSSYLVRQLGTDLPVTPVFNPNFFNIKRMLDSLALLWGQINQRASARKAPKGH